MRPLFISWLLMNVAVCRHGVERLAPDAALLVSHALQLRLRTLLEKLSVVTEHRTEIYRVSVVHYRPFYQVDGFRHHCQQ